MRRAMIVAGLACGLAVSAGAAAQAATVEYTASAGAASDGYIQYTASKGEDNRVTIRELKRSFIITDKGTKLLRAKTNEGFKNTCKRRNAKSLICPNEFAVAVFANLRDGNDKISYLPRKPPRKPEVAITDPVKLAESYEDTEGALQESAFIDGGSGNDVIRGTRFDDTIVPGTGKDRVYGLEGPDRILLQPDGEKDRISGGPGLDTVQYSGSKAVTVDLAAGTGGRGDDLDTLLSINRVHGTDSNDILRGSDGADALYGEGGNDEIDGRGGNDLLVGDSPITTDSSANRITGGPGDDLVDARGAKLAPTTTISCGEGNDRMAGEVDDRVDATCESAVYREPRSFLPDETPLFDVLTPIEPVTRGADGAPTFAIPCPTSEQVPNTGCTGTVTLQTPPVAGATGGVQALGSGSFAITPGNGANVAVVLNAAGKSALAVPGAPISVHVKATLAPPAGSSSTPGQADYGWQEVLTP